MKIIRESYEAQKVSSEKLSEIIDDRSQYGKFYAIEGDVVVAVDNSSGDAWTEEFKNEEDAIRWLTDEELTMDDFEEDLEKKPKILTEENVVKIIMKQNITTEIDTDVDYEVDESEVIENIRDVDISTDLLKYMKEYSYDDEFKEVYNSTRKVTVDTDYDNIRCIVELGVNFEDSVLENIFSDFIKEVVLQDDQFSGYGTAVLDEPFESDPYETGFNSLNDEISYSTSMIDEVDYDYTILASGEQETTIER